MTTKLPGIPLPLLASGKVRDLYEVDPNSLLFVASDRVSAFDVVMQNGIPQKGAVLTHMTDFWLKYLHLRIPELKTHFITLDLPGVISPELRPGLVNRSMLVRRLKVFPIEAIVRGYITGSAWASYKKTGEVNGKKLPEGMQESQQFPEAIYTPSTKAELGQHDENISVEQAAQMVGTGHAQRIEQLALKIYAVAQEYARERGIIIADTKLEFGLDRETDEVVLIDEVLTPDSSRFWSVENYELGRSQNSFDKQGLRDWLTTNGLKNKEGVEMPEDIVRETSEKYLEAFERLTSRPLRDVLRS